MSSFSYWRKAAQIRACNRVLSHQQQQQQPAGLSNIAGAKSNLLQL
jgi:hypothetical protein